MNRDFVAAMRKVSFAFATAVAFCVPLLGGCGVKGPLKLPTPPPPATGALPSAPPSTTPTGTNPPAPQAAGATDATPSAAAPQPTERAP